MGQVMLCWQTVALLEQVTEHVQIRLTSATYRLRSTVQYYIPLSEFHVVKSSIFLNWREAMDQIPRLDSLGRINSNWRRRQNSRLALNEDARDVVTALDPTAQSSSCALSKVSFQVPPTYLPS